MKLNKGNKRGISLIVLVITIIVMIILAAAIILSLNSSGIIGKANKAKADSDDANLLQAANVAAAEWNLKHQLGETTDDAKTYITNSLVNQNFTEEQIAKLGITESGEVSLLTYTMYSDGTDEAPIPFGFIASDVDGEDTIEGGLVIYEGSEQVSTDTDAKTTRNQFVWIPVPDIDDFARLKTGTKNYTGVLYKFSASGATEITTNTNWEPGIVTIESIPEAAWDLDEKYISLIRESKYSSLEQQFQAEFDYMVASVKEHGGFYVGRYETSLINNNVKSIKTESKDEIFTADINLGSNWTIGGNIATWYGLYAKQKEMYNTDSAIGVVSGMIYGCQWDAIMNWMLDGTDEEKLFVTSSTGKGNYYVDQIASMDDYCIGTGSNPAYCEKNIYDLAGNYGEWTQEIYKDDYMIGRNYRGGNFWDGIGMGASFREERVLSLMEPNSSYGMITSRLQLYIK